MPVVIPAVEHLTVSVAVKGTARLATWLTVWPTMLLGVTMWVIGDRGSAHL